MSRCTGRALGVMKEKCRCGLNASRANDTPRAGVVNLTIDCLGE